MDYMFANTRAFNQPLNNWNVSNVNTRACVPRTVNGTGHFGPTIPECPSEQTRECLYDTDEPAEACGGVCTEAGAPCSLNLGVGFEGTCFATETDDAEGDVFICGCCEAGEGYEDASGNALPLCQETQLEPPGLNP